MCRDFYLKTSIMKQLLLTLIVVLSSTFSFSQLTKEDKKEIGEYCKQVNSLFKGVSQNTQELIVKSAKDGSDFEEAMMASYAVDSATVINDLTIISTLETSFTKFDEKMTTKYGKTMDQMYTSNSENVMTYLKDRQECGITWALYIFGERKDEPVDDYYYDYYDEE